MRAALAPRRRLGARRRRRCRLVHRLVPERDRPGLQLLQDLLLLIACDLLVGDHRVEDRLQVGDEPAAELRLGDRRALRVSDLVERHALGQVGLQLLRRDAEGLHLVGERLADRFLERGVDLVLAHPEVTREMGDELLAHARRGSGRLVCHSAGGGDVGTLRAAEVEAVACGRGCHVDGGAGDGRGARREAHDAYVFWRGNGADHVDKYTARGTVASSHRGKASVNDASGPELYSRVMESPPNSGWGSGKHAVELYVRTYTTMLQSSGEIKVDSLVQTHIRMGSVLHPLAGQPQSDMGALLYAVRRLPRAIDRSRHVVMGQSPQGFRAVLGADIMEWQPVKAPARRRRWYQDGRTLAVLIASTSDIDDLIPSLVAYQIEWNKLHKALQSVELADESAREAAGASEDDWQRLHEAWGESFDSTLDLVQKEECHIGLRLIGGSHLGYARMAARWWLPIAGAMAELGVLDSPVYFVSSNAHSLVNVLSGTAREFEREILDWVRDNDPELEEERHKLEVGHSRASRQNWLYFAARQIFDLHPDREQLRKRRAELEAARGIRHIPAKGTGVDSAAQVCKLSSLDASAIDPRVGTVDVERLRASGACIVNVDYPLGFAGDRKSTRLNSSHVAISYAVFCLK